MRGMLDLGCVELKLEAKDMEEVLEKLCALFLKSGAASDAKELYEAFLERERKGATSLGFEVATPHAKSGCVIRPALAFARLDRAIAWGDEEVSLIFAIAVPKDASNEHLNILAQLARKLVDKAFLQELKEAKTALDIKAALR